MTKKSKVFRKFQVFDVATSQGQIEIKSVLQGLSAWHAYLLRIDKCRKWFNKVYMLSVVVC